MQDKAKEIFLRITSFSPREELGGIDRQWIIDKIAEGLQEVKDENKAFRDTVSTMRYNQKEYFRNARQYGSASPQATSWLSDSKASEKKVDDYLSGKGGQTSMF